MSPDLPFDVPKRDNPRIDGVSYMLTNSDGVSHTMHLRRDSKFSEWRRLDESASGCH